MKHKVFIFMVFAIALTIFGCGQETAVAPEMTALIDNDALSLQKKNDGADLAVSVEKAPVAPDGTTAGAPTDFVVTFVDPNPAIPGIGLKAGAKIRVTLPEGFVNTDLETPITGVILQGWPQSPRLPLPAPEWEAATNTIVLTLSFDWLPAGPEAPGPKQAHLILLGFRNPGPGHYPVPITIQPDPDTGKILRGSGSVEIIPTVKPSLNVVSLVNGAPPPPFPNPIYQTVGLGEAPLLFGFYLWKRGGAPFVGVKLVKQNRTVYLLVDDDGMTVGHAKIVMAPWEARDFSLTSASPSTEVPAFVTGVPTGLLTVQLHPDPEVAGMYTVKFKLFGGNRQKMFVTVTNSGDVPTADISAAPTRVDFGNVDVGSSKDKTFVLKNDGASDLKINNAQVAGSSAEQYTVLDLDIPAVLAPGESREVTVRFSPTSSGIKKGQVKLFSNDPDENHFPVSFKGEGSSSP